MALDVGTHREIRSTHLSSFRIHSKSFPIQPPKTRLNLNFLIARALERRNCVMKIHITPEIREKSGNGEIRMGFSQLSTDERISCFRGICARINVVVLRDQINNSI